MEKVRERKATPKYKTCLVAFVDVLGFKQLIATATGPARILELVDALNVIADVHQGSKRAFDSHFVQFSDCFVRSTNLLGGLNRTRRYGVLYHEIRDLVFAQAMIACEGIFLRGALTIDLLYRSGATIFGPGLVRAYTLESEVALHPRIIVDPRILTAAKTTDVLRAWHHTEEYERQYLSKMLRRDGDGLWFVDYLNGITTHFGEEFDFVEFLTTHKRRIIEAAASISGLNRVAAKYAWLASYHNSVVRESDETRHLSKRQHAELLIDDADLGKLYDFRLKS